LLAGLLLASVVPSQAVWQLTWSDEFDGTNVDLSKWTFETGNNDGWGNQEREYYTTNNAYVSGGLLHIVARRESMGGFPYTSARMKTQGLFSQKYGKFEFRAKLPQGVGMWPALWTLGNNINPAGWPACGEIDVMENNGSYPNQVQGTIHYSDASNNHLQQTRVYPLPGGYVTNFHTYAIEWTTNQITWVVDGTPIQAWTSWSSSTGPYPAPFNQPFFILMNLAVGGNFVGNPTDAQINAGTVFPAEMQVEYVRVYKNVPTITPPAQVTGLRASASSSAVYLNWDASSTGATAYNVKRSTTPGGNYTTIATPLSNTYTDAGVSSCSTYYYVVSGTNIYGEGTNSTEVTAAPPAYSLALNSGGSLTNQYLADTYFSGGSQAAPVTTTIDTSGVSGAAPQSVYQTERYGNFTYTIPGLTAGRTYLVRLHFAETYWTATGQRRFNVNINGTQVLSSFDIVAAAGAPNTAVVREFNAVPVSGQITIQYATVTDNAKASGIELLLPPPAAPSNLVATPGNTAVALSWSSGANGVAYNVKRSASAPGPYTLVAGSLSSTNYTDSGLTNGVPVYYVVSATQAGCESTNSLSANAIPICSTPPAPTAENNGPLWQGMALSLTASTVPGATYAWTGPNGFSSTAQNPTLPNAPLTAAGNYFVTATVGSCVSTSAVTSVAISPVPALAFDASNGGLVLTWPAGTLQVATNLPPTWLNVPGATSPYTNALDFSPVFYRLRLP
jgi:beta-glucanase (GH16 family)